MPKTRTLHEALAEALPQGLDFLFYHLSTPPEPCSPVFSPPPQQAETQTFCERHLLLLSLPCSDTVNGEVLAFALEVLVFITDGFNTIFVSKADSTGYLHLSSLPPGAPSVLKTICTTLLSLLVFEYSQCGRVLLCLFARSQNQYLFPGSVDSAGKHVLDDRKLIKWWCTTLNPLVRHDESPYVINAKEMPSSTNTCKAHIIVPGCDKAEIRAFLPLSARLERDSKWSIGYPPDLIRSDDGVPLRCLIPRFPDDPKARFLDDLDAEVPEEELRANGNWRAVQSLDQFWEMMSYRQECSAGRLVGFLWLIYTPKGPAVCQTGERLASKVISPAQCSSAGSTATETVVQKTEKTAVPEGKDERLVNAEAKLSHGGVGTILPETANQSSQGSCWREHASSAPKPHRVPWPKECRGKLISTATYEYLMSHLVQKGEFSTLSKAVASTATWTAEISSLSLPGSLSQTPGTLTDAFCGTMDLPIRVTGRKVLSASSPSTEGFHQTKQQNNDQQGPNVGKVNVLTGVRRGKKRKLDGDAGTVTGQD